MRGSGEGQWCHRHLIRTELMLDSIKHFSCALRLTTTGFRSASLVVGIVWSSMLSCFASNIESPMSDQVVSTATTPPSSPPLPGPATRTHDPYFHRTTRPAPRAKRGERGSIRYRTEVHDLLSMEMITTWGFSSHHDELENCLKGKT